MQKLQTAIGTCLLIGVLVSSVVVIIGGMIYLSFHGHDITNYRVYASEPIAYKSVLAIWRDAFSFSGRSIIQFGILLLVLVQFLRVLLTIGVFARLRDTRFVLISLFIFAVLMFSFCVRV